VIAVIMARYTGSSVISAVETPPLTARRSGAHRTGLVVGERTQRKTRAVDSGGPATGIKTPRHSGVGTAKSPVSARVKSLILNGRVGTMVLALAQNIGVLLKKSSRFGAEDVKSPDYTSIIRSSSSI
jgi:hypothetical protein